MKYCPMCGCTVEDTAIFCPKCGAAVNTQSGYQTYTAPQQPPVDTGNIGWGFLGFFVPVAGLILYLCWMQERPKDALMAGKGALISVIAGVVLTVICFALYALIFAAIFATV